MRASVRARVAAVDIVQDAGVDHRVVERRVEDRLLFVAAAFDANPPQLFVPLFAGVAFHFVEGLVGDLRLEIFPGALHVHERNARLEDDLLVCCGFELGEETDVFALDFVDARDYGRFGHALEVGDADHFVFFARPVVGNVGAPEAVTLDRFAETCVEVDRVVGVSLAVAPAARGGRAPDPSGDGVFVEHLDVLAFGRAADPARQVDLDTRQFVGGEREAQDAAVRRGRTFGLDAVIGQAGAVIACCGRFTRFVVARTVPADAAVLLACDFLQGPGRRHDEKVSQVAEPAHAAHLREGESLDGRVFVTVSGAVVPARNGIRAYLHHAIGGRGPGEGLPQSVVDACGAGARARPDERVHVVGRGEFLRAALRGASGESR